VTAPLVKLIVPSRDRSAGTRIIRFVGDDRISDHFAGDVGELAEVDRRMESAVGCAVAGEVRREVGDAFEVDANLERRGDKTEVSGDRLLKREQLGTVVLNGEISLVHLVVSLDHLLNELVVAGFCGLDCGIVSVGDEITHVDDARSEPVEPALVVLAGH